jgi:hypothetical protein
MTDDSDNEVYLIETHTDGSWKPTAAVGLTQEKAERKMAEWSKDLPERRFRVRKYRAVIGGFLMLAFGLSLMVAGLNGWASEINRGMTAPGVYEQKHLKLNDKPYGYDNWTEQLKRKKDRGR